MVTLLPPPTFDDAAAWRLARALDELAASLDRAGEARVAAVGLLDDWTGGARREFDRHSGEVQQQVASLVVAVRTASGEVVAGTADAAAERRRRELVNEHRLADEARRLAARRAASAAQTSGSTTTGHVGGRVVGPR